MNSAISIPLLGFSCFSLVALIVTHALISRYAAVRLPASSPQILLVKLTLILNVPIMVATGWIARHEIRGQLETIYMLIFVLLVFNGLAYAYFHFFNMSETARRIRMLIQIHRAGPAGLRVTELEREYSPQDMIDARLERLVKMDQLSLDSDNHYRVRGKLLLCAGRIMAGWRYLIWRRAAGNVE